MQNDDDHPITPEELEELHDELDFEDRQMSIEWVYEKLLPVHKNTTKYEMLMAISECLEELSQYIDDGEL